MTSYQTRMERLHKNYYKNYPNVVFAIFIHRLPPCYLAFKINSLLYGCRILISNRFFVYVYVCVCAWACITSLNILHIENV
jgi:hypothetical protein